MPKLTIVLLVLLGAVAQAEDKRPTKIWNRQGPLGETPKHVTDAYPLSDQQNKGGWVKFEPMSDEFEGKELDRSKWIVGMEWWKGRQPALFSEKNVTVSDGKLHLTMRKEKLPPEAEKLGYHDYTSAALHTKARSAYGYYEVKAKPMNSGGSSSFWFQTGRDARLGTEIDVFEIGGKAKGFEQKYNMTLHVSQTPQGEEALERGRHLDRPVAAGRRLPRLRPGLGQGRDQVLRRWRAGPIRREHALAPAALPDLRQRDDARVVRDAQGRGLALHVQHRICAGVEEG